MNRDEKRVALAKLDGWIYPGSTDLIFEQWQYWIPPAGAKGRRVPDYHSDLNALHRLWCKLTPKQHSQFRVALQAIVVRDGHICGPCRSLSNATAEQRAEAILKTFGLWTE